MANKKSAIALSTLAELILIIIAAVIIIVIVMAILGFISPATGSMGCGLNLRIRGTVPAKVVVPVFMCNQYKTPINIDGTNWNACPGINKTFCESAKGSFSLEDSDTDKYKCAQQCAQIQIDLLAEACWKMAGEGKYKLSSWMQDIGEVAITAGTAGLVEIEASDVVRCFRYRISEPPITVGDGSYGLGYVITDKGNFETLANYYNLHRDENIISQSPAVTPRMYLNEYIYEDLIEEIEGNLSKGAYTTILKDNKLVEDKAKHHTEQLNYNMDKEREICYISFVDSTKSISRDCDSWAPGVKTIHYIN